MIKFCYKKRTPEDLCEEAINQILDGKVVSDYDLESLLEEFHVKVDDDLCQLKIKAVTAGSCSDLSLDKLKELDEQLIIATFQAVTKHNAQLLASKIRNIVSKQVYRLFDNGELDLVGLDHEQQQSEYDDYCCGIREEQMLHDYAAEHAAE